MIEIVIPKWLVEAWAITVALILIGAIAGALYAAWLDRKGRK